MAAAAPPIKGFKVNQALGATDASGALAAIIATGASRGVGINIAGTFVGTVQFEQTIDGGLTWISKTMTPAAGGAGVISATATGQWKAKLGGETHIRVRCSAFTSGSIVVDISCTAGEDSAAGGLPASLGPKAPNSSLSVTPAGLQYETVAASQTAQAMGATGATGDYLSHVVFQPITTAAGTSTILDNATVIYTFTTGTLSDLRPITVPIGAFSVSGAWKITTGANITATGFGNFT